MEAEAHNGVARNGTTPPAISVVIPCLNEEEAIGLVVKRALAGIADVGMPGEVVVVDNASTDGSASAARRAGARVVHEPRRGYGHALQRGFAEARGRYIIMADGDDTYPVDNLAPFIELIHQGCDVVYGDRFAFGTEGSGMPWTHAHIGTPVLSWLARQVSGTDVVDSNCGMRAFRREALEHLDLRAPGMDFSMEILMKSAQAGLRIGQVPIKLAPRVGDSKLETIPDGWRNLRYLLMRSPDHLFVLPGTVLLVLGLFTLVLQALSPSGIAIGPYTWRPDYAPVVLGAVGAQVIWFGVLAKLYYAATGMVGERQRNGRLIHWFARTVGLERLLLSSLCVAAVGVVLEFLLGLRQLAVIEPHAALASIGAFCVVVGLQSFFSSFIAYLLSAEHLRPQAAPPAPTVQAVTPELVGDGAPPVLETV